MAKCDQHNLTFLWYSFFIIDKTLIWPPMGKQSLTYYINEWHADTLLSNHTLTRGWDTRNTGEGALVCTHLSQILAFLELNPDISWPTATEWFSAHQNKAIPLHRCFRRLSFTFYLKYCVCYKYITAILRLHAIFVLHGGARRLPGPFCPVLTGPSYPIHNSAVFFTFTCNLLTSLPFR